MEKVRINCPSDSHLPKKGFFCIGILDISIPLQPLLIKVANILDARIDDRNPPVTLKQICHFIKRKSSLVDCENLTIDHVIKIAPDSVEGDLEFLEVVDDFLQV